MHSKTRKVVVNNRLGIFQPSEKVFERLIEEGFTITTVDENKQPLDPDAQIIDFGQDSSDEGKKEKSWNFRYGFQDDYNGLKYRDHPVLISVIEELRREANTHLCEFKIIEIPADVEFEIQSYDGSEWVAERHRKWGYRGQVDAD